MDTTTADMHAAREFAAVVAIARRESRGGLGMTAAEMDYSLSCPPGVVGTDGLDAHAAIQDAIVRLANEDVPLGSLTVAEMIARADVLRGRVQSRLDAMIEAAKAKSYTGWSTASRGPIRYADAS